MRIRLEHRYPQYVLEERGRVQANGSFRERAQYDLIDRPPYVFGLLTAADIARSFTLDRISVMELGVADGAGLLNLCEIAPRVTEETGVSFDIIGLDNGTGLPTPRDFRDHPEIWSEGDFAMRDRQDLEAKLPSFANLVIGDLSETLPGVLARVAEAAPIGFVAHDLDLYSSTEEGLAVYQGAVEKMLPVSIAYFDDTLGNPGRIGSLFRNEWCGQLSAIRQFNERQSYRKIDRIRTLRQRRPLRHELWTEKVYAVHALDHPLRSRTRRDFSLSMSEHATLSHLEWPY